ncbi:glycosyl hydrolase family 65 protein, partial [Listeria booriae]|uniref:glycosyl hydrolase family 65 protein n=1 Tax=Listeria booriae TaxID=1552123 RepID=UPI0017CD3094
REELLQITPNLPDAWQSLTFEFVWKGERIGFKITPKTPELSKTTTSVLELIINGEKHSFTDKLTINFEQKDVSL